MCRKRFKSEKFAFFFAIRNESGAESAQLLFYLYIPIELHFALLCRSVA